MPRDMRLRAWKVIRTRTVQHEDKTILAQHLRNQERYFLEMERFAKQAQAYIDEDKASIEAARIQDEYRRRRQAEERALRDKLKDARLEALEKEITLEEAQQFVRENIPHNARSGFREWFKKEYGGDLSCLMAAAKEFIALQGEKPAKDIKDKVIARPFGTDIPIENFNSVHAMMQETGTGNDADARQFRLAVKDQGVAIWPDDDPRKNSQTALDGRRWEVLLPHLRPVDAELDDYVPEKRKGRRAAYGALSRPDQKAFSDSVYDNCYGQGVVTGARSRRRCEAAHLVEHCKDGVDHWSNGLWLSIDIHRLFDANQCAINPETLCVHFTPDVLAEDEDLKGLEGQSIAMTKKPINAAFLWARWEVFTSGD
ncbi:HNH endonuclease signature motif containing protein [Enterobacter asburiae]|uniref:HNH endonuclease signature motif containing protein n=3 Tax=Enterobacteriaceae TaxID=543 RepID=A0AAW7ZMY3_ENTAS|nr:HNH endonuclease signature motif containing protein [Enterobacter asburiae]MCL8160545.1 HNH endonuclease [Enterobacter asburiae]MCM7941961.1 HNH endonuclease [Enterobacter asburiae]MDO7921067.1 HNH endonuclease signature motif containing protein [Enterobacter asburiae]MDV0913740.1 HNH endonuclease signature motif containing protein [Enterobacter asburiae]MDV0933751.1 HNH endonuclease signature motif containing protein [Enterobacter asburiae]